MSEAAPNALAEHVPPHLWALVAAIGGNSRSCSCRMCAAARERHHFVQALHSAIPTHGLCVTSAHVCVCALPKGVRDPDALSTQLLLPNLSCHSCVCLSHTTR